MNNEQLKTEITQTFDQLIELLKQVPDSKFNKIPFEGSWTTGQLAGHLLKATGGIPDQVTKPSPRSYDEQVEPIKAMFLNFDIKMKSPDFTLPDQDVYEKEAVIKTLEAIKRSHLVTCDSKNLEELCVTFELPAFGYLTRYEWLKFIVIHTQRHIRQLQNIARKLEA